MKTDIEYVTGSIANQMANMSANKVVRCGKRLFTDKVLFRQLLKEKHSII